ncbi:hypothetical protein [Ancylothrix sp. D3o]|uniref:hypothetical protein n=1 Tax=Ancylothrix sp. D3o TaxID=2953691 RepID=UPI0021BA4A62|nr:hypothetical protein [Ancylothrix sp. D3o]
MLNFSHTCLQCSFYFIRQVEAKENVMYNSDYLPMCSVINDLDALISEMDNNPALSPWVVRLVLKSIKDKAIKMATGKEEILLCLEEEFNIKALLN